MTFPLQPPQQFAGPPPAFQRPREVGQMSRDDNLQWHFDNRQELRLLACPPSTCDLNDGLASFIQKDVDAERRQRLRPIQDYLDFKGLLSSDALKGTIVAWRGTLTKLMCAVYEQWNGWRIHARRRNGVVYLWEEETDEALTRRKQNEAQPESRDARMCYWGYKFEQFCCSANAEAVHAQDIETLSREWTQPVDTRASYCSLVATRLDRHPLLMAGEVDCCVPETPGVQSPTSVHSRYVELKTSRVLQSEHDQVKFERKMLKLWAQSFLLGIPTIIVGFRDDQGTVRDIQTFETVSMARLVRGKPHAWDASVALRSLSAILAHITLHLDRLEHSSSATLVEPALQLDFAKPFKAIHLSTSTVDFLS